MKNLSVRSETRIIRPFLGLEPAVELIERVRFIQGSQEFSPGPVLLPAHKLKERGYRIKFNFKAEELVSICKSAGVSNSDAGLAIFANSRMLRKSILIFAQPISAKMNLPQELELEDNVEDELSKYVFLDSTGFEIFVCIVLLKDVEPKPLRVQSSGTWLARSKFLVKPEEDLSNFAPEHLTDALKEQFGLPKDSLSFVFAGENLLQSDDLSEVVTIYLDSEVLNLLLIDESDESSKYLQSALAVQTVETVVQIIAKSLKEDGLHASDLTADSGANRFLSQLSVDLKKTIEEILEISISNPSLLRAFLESRFKLRNVAELLLKRGQ